MPTISTKYDNTIGGRTAEISVDQGMVVTVALAHKDGTPLPPGLQARVQRKVGGNWQNVPFDRGVPAIVTGDAAEASFTSPGIFSLLLPASAKAIIAEENR